MSRFTVAMIGFNVGLVACAIILWVRVEDCRSASPTGQCAITLDWVHGIKLAGIQWPKNG